MSRLPICRLRRLGSLSVPSVLVVVATTLFSFLLPRPLFFKLIKIAFPFLPERLERGDN
jgi:hypothetical protein